MRGAAGTVVLRLTSAGLGFVISVVLARRLGIVGYGQYSYALSWALLLGVLSLGGLDRLLVRQVAVCRTQGQWGALRGLLRWTTGVGLAASVGLAGLAAALGVFFAAHLAVWLRPEFSVSGFPGVWLLAPLLVLMRIPQSALRGLNFIIRGQIPDAIIQPLVLISGIIVVAYLNEGRLSPAQALGIYVFSTMAAAAIAYGFLSHSLPREVKATPAVYHYGVWIAAALPLLLVSGLDIVNSQMDILMLGPIAGAKAVALYSVADRGTSLIAFPLTAANASLTPTFASLHAAGERAQLQRIVTKSAQGVLLSATMIALGLVLGRAWFLHLFGTGFFSASGILLTLTAGQWANAAAGSVASLLLMTGYAREAAQGIGLSVGVNFLLNLALIPHWGAEGAAVAVALSTVLWNVLLAGFVWRRLGLTTTAWGSNR